MSKVSSEPKCGGTSCYFMMKRNDIIVYELQTIILKDMI